MKALRIDSPAKLNLSLRVLGRLPDGYHRLHTVYHRISFHDTLFLRKKRPGFSLTTTHPGLPCGKKNIVTRCYRLLREKFSALSGVSVHLVKRIPLESGLGGGSSNAAFFLMGMNKLFSLSLTLSDMCKLGSQLGADVPFFLYRVNQAIGTDRGQRIAPNPVRNGHWFVLILYNKGLSTAGVYHRYDKHLERPLLTKQVQVARIASPFRNKRDPWEVSLGLHNDLEIPALKLKPELGCQMGVLAQLGVPAVGMSGSGPTIFAVLKNRREAVTVARRLGKLPHSGKIVICRTY